MRVTVWLGSLCPILDESVLSRAKPSEVELWQHYRLGALMTSTHAVEDSAEGNAEPDDTPADSAMVGPSTGTAAEEEQESDRGRNSSGIGE